MVALRLLYKTASGNPRGGPAAAPVFRWSNRPTDNRPPTAQGESLTLPALPCTAGFTQEKAYCPDGWRQSLHWPASCDCMDSVIGGRPYPQFVKFPEILRIWRAGIPIALTSVVAHLTMHDEPLRCSAGAYTTPTTACPEAQGESKTLPVLPCTPLAGGRKGRPL